MKRTAVAAIGLLTALTVGACGGDDDFEITSSAPGTAADSTGGEGSDTESTTGGDMEAESTGGVTTDADATGGVTTETTDGATPLPTPDDVFSAPAPIDTEDMVPAAGPPGPGLIHFRSVAIASAGGVTKEFKGGFDNLWWTEFNPAGKPIWDMLNEMDPDREDPYRTEQFDSFFVGSCSVIQTADGLIAQASFHRRTERNRFSSFSMSDNGDGTVVWGLYDTQTGEEWSATGEGSATVTFWTYPDAGPDSGVFGNTARQEVWHIRPRTDDVVVLIEFAGDASENFSTEKGTASSRVICQYVRPIS